MRIISGNFKGKKIFQPVDNYTRPLKDLTKESIFNIIEHSKLFKTKIDKSNILDLFSGTGSFGLECISRNANSVMFFENYPKTIFILKKNIQKMDCNEKTVIIEKDVTNIELFDFIDKKFDIIFLDPPYKEEKLSKLVDKLIHLNLLKQDGIFIIHRHKKTKDTFSKNFKVLKEVTYGISKIIFGK